jgi:prevent-host-death family protein
MPTEIGAFEAKTRFSEILRKVDAGERFSVTRRGRTIAQIIPPEPEIKPVPEDVIQRLMNPAISGISGDTVLEWIREGRK